VSIDKFDLSNDPERLAAIVESSWERPDEDDAVIVSGTLPGGRRIYGRYSRAVVDAARAATPAPAPVAATPERPRPAPSPFATLPAPMRAAVEAALARTPAPVPTPRPQLERPAATAARADVDRLLALTPLGQDVLRNRAQAEREAAARAPAPISDTVRRGLEATHLGRAVLAERRDPEGEARAAGLDPSRRRKMRVTNLGGAVIALGSDATVTCGSGYPLNAGESLLDDAPAAHDAWWAVSCGGAINNGDVRVMEISD
jgi:hypothetical protein